MEKREFKDIIEALLFVCEKPLSLDEIKELLGLEKRFIRELIEELKVEYIQNHCFRIREVAGGYQVVTDSKYAPWLRKLFRQKRNEQLSKAALETLAIVAFKQPITKPEIEFIRGVDVDGVLKGLLEKGLIRIAGRKKTVGRPLLYATTKKFLEYFGLNSLEELPSPDELLQKEGEINGDQETESRDR